MKSVYIFGPIFLHGEDYLPIYKGKDVFGVEGIKELKDDMAEVFDYFALFKHGRRT